MSGPAKDSSPPLLDPAQSRFLADFFAREKRFFLTGGGALGGFHLRHRRSGDLDLFTTNDAAIAELPLALSSLSAGGGWMFTTLRESPSFRRLLARAPGGDEVRLDFVRDVDYQAVPDKPIVGGVAVDSLPDLCANKICAVLTRIEPRDYVDLYFLEREGYRVEDHLPHAVRKDAGVEAPVLGALLREARVTAPPPFLEAPLDLEALRAWLADLSARLARFSFPQ